MKRLRRIAAIMLVVVLSISCAACEKTKKNGKNSGGNSDEQLAVYEIYAEEEFEYVVSYTELVDNIIYGTYAKDIYGQNGEPKYGLFQYDFTTKNVREMDFENEVKQVINMYVDTENHLVVNLKQNDSNVSDEDNSNGENSDEGEIKQEVNTEEINTEEVNTEEIFHYYQCVYDTDFELLSKIELDKSLFEDSKGFIVSWFVCGDKNVKLVEITDTNHNIIIEDEAGNEIEKIEIEDVYVDRFIKNDNDTVVMLTNDLDAYEYKIYTLDISVEEKYSLNEVVELKNAGKVSISQKGEDEILVNADGYLQVLDLHTGKLKKILKYIDSAIEKTYVSDIYQINENSYAILLYNYVNENSVVDLVSSGKSVTEKEEIHLATMWTTNQEQRDKVMEFNRKSDEYKIVVDEYLDENDMTITEEEVKKAVQQFNLDIVTGNGADIIDVSNYIDIKQYANKGIFEDLSFYLENDKDISEEDFIENAFEACKADGILYTISPDFGVGGIAGATRWIGDETTWTMEEFMDYAAQLPSDVEMFDFVTSEHLLDMLLLYNLDEFIDWKQGKCHFDSDRFISILEFCGHYPTYEERIANGDYSEMTYGIAAIREHKTELYEFGIRNIGDYLNLNMIFDEDITIKGVPVSEGTGIKIFLDGNYMYAINSKSKYKEGAWEFIKQFFEYDNQMSMSSFPIMKEAFEDKIEEERNKKTGENLNIGPDGTEYFSVLQYGDISIYCLPPTDEDIAKMKEIISRADTVSDRYGPEIFDIIEEEAESYYAGQKSSREVADIIQSRVSIYVSEKR